MSSGQSTISEDENDPLNGSNAPKVQTQLSSEDSTLTLNDGVMSRSGSNRDKESKYSKSRSPVMQSLNPTQLQPPSSILKAEVLDENSEVKNGQKVSEKASFDSKRLLQRTCHVDINDPEQPLLFDEEQGLRSKKDLDTIHSVSPPVSPGNKWGPESGKSGENSGSVGSAGSEVPRGVIPAGLRSRSPQINSGWL